MLHPTHGAMGNMRPDQGHDITWKAYKTEQIRMMRWTCDELGRRDVCEQGDEEVDEDEDMMGWNACLLMVLIDTHQLERIQVSRSDNIYTTSHHTMHRIL